MPSYHTPFILVSVSHLILGSESFESESFLGHTPHSSLGGTRDNSQRITSFTDLTASFRECATTPHRDTVTERDCCILYYRVHTHGHHRPDTEMV
jgi:hypothetical protein